jgi:hypothetical protein
MVVPLSPRISSHFVRPFQDFLATTHSQLNERRGVEQPPVENFGSTDNGDIEATDQSKVAESFSSRRAQLLVAIINNSPDDVQSLCSMEQRQLEHDDEEDYLDPNVSFVVSRIPKKKESHQNTMDLVFAVKALLGESPTAIHLAILNVIFRSIDHCRSKTKHHAHSIFRNFIKARSHDGCEINKSHQILQILMEKSINIQQPSPTLFGPGTLEEPVPRQVTPLDMAWSIHSILSQTEYYAMNEIETFLLDLEEKNKGDREDRRDDGNGQGRENALETGSTCSHIAPAIAQGILHGLFCNNQQTQRTHILHTITTLGFAGEEFESSSVVCVEGFHLLCGDKQ